jgi:hypothetical protein
MEIWRQVVIIMPINTVCRQAHLGNILSRWCRSLSLSLARRVFALLLVHAGINDVVKQTPAVFLLSRLHGETTSKTSCVAAQSTADLFRKYGARISARLQLY